MEKKKYIEIPCADPGCNNTIKTKSLRGWFCKDCATRRNRQSALRSYYRKLEKAQTQ